MTSFDATIDADARRDRRAIWLLATTSFVLYAYFFQGTGWNQNAHFDTVRAFVENGTAEITPFATNTGDVSRIGDRVFSNKPPGLPLAGVPVYWLATRIEGVLGVDFFSPRVVNYNMHLTTAFVSSLPGALIVVAM